MQPIEQILSNIQTSSDFLNFIGILLTALVSLYIFKRESSTTFIRERHDKLIFPLFDLLEPFLYKDIPEDKMAAAVKIIEDNKNISDGKLLEILYHCSKHPSPEHAKQLCIYVDRTYDKSCWRLGLKLRSITYRINRDQYKHKALLFLWIILCSLISIFIAMLFFVACLCGMSVLLSFLYTISDATNPFVTVFIIIFLCSVLIKCFEKFS